MTIGCPLSMLIIMEPTSVEAKSASPETMVSNANGRLMYCTSTNPSAWKSCSAATYWGAKQIAGLCPSLSVLVSGGASAKACLGVRPCRPTVPASITPLRNFRRLNGRVCCILMGTSLLDASQCDPENADQWTLLPSYEQAQHLTPAVSRARKLKRGTSVSCRASAPVRCSARCVPAVVGPLS